MQNKSSNYCWAIVMTIVMLSLPLSSWAGKTQDSEGLAAKINKAVITRKVFEKALSQIEQRFARSGKTLSDSQLAEIKKNVLEELINRELLHQESQKKGFIVKTAQVHKQLSQMRGQYATEAEFQRALSMMGFFEKDLESQVKQWMETRQFVREMIVKDITIPETDIRASYESHPHIFKQPESIRASHILITVDPTATETQKTEARKKIDTIKKKLAAGEDFAALAKVYSQGPSSDKGGDLGYFRRGQMVGPFEAAAFALKPGQVSDVVETRFGYHLIKVVDKKPPFTIPYEDARGKIAQYLKNEKVQKQLNQYIEQLKQSAVIERFIPRSK